MIARVTRNEFSKGFFDASRPAIVADALGDWRIAERWTPAYLAAVAQSRAVVSSRANDGQYRFEPSHDGARSHAFDNSETAFGEVARRLADPDAGDPVYVMQQSIPDKLPELLGNLVVPHWIEAERPAINLWFGRRTTTQLHFDYSNNFFAQLHGSKAFTLFDPRDSDCLYPYPHETATAHLSHVDVDRPDLERYPDFARASPMRFTMEAGELLFLPAFWWHHVSAPGVAVSVNFWWQPGLRQILDARNSTRALPSLYAIDRLRSFKQSFLEPAQLDFVTAAERFLDHGRTWAAGILALAAFDEWGSGGPWPGAARRPAGCRLSGLADDLRELGAIALARDGAPTAQRHAIEDAASLAGAVAQRHDDALIERERVAALLHAVTVLGAAPGTASA
ncbi:cupin-like domain-containing protein [Trinickia terrae]|uniref:Cupin-like domain-containing protein n=1 Tax=Trinickia terrae TaxID=2571161 RepID=A0A4U1I9Z0_9BURK|nr:cupin-like domain-containing protein [Trinickia terrae]TKC90316.1 cupin-like domain-containing protein [Trinickia terrae]